MTQKDNKETLPGVDHAADGAGAVPVVGEVVPVNDGSGDGAGVALRDSRGRMLRPLPGQHVITQANASTLAKKRWDIARRKAALRVVEEAAAVDPRVTLPSDAWALVVARQYVAMLDSDKPRVDDLAKLGQLLGLVRGPNDNADGGNGAAAVVNSPIVLILAELARRDGG